MSTSLGIMETMAMVTIIKPPYVPNNHPFVPYPNANDKWKPVSSSNDIFEAIKFLWNKLLVIIP